MIQSEILPVDPPPATPDVTQPINQTSASYFVQCFFKNRFSIDDPEELGNTCMPPDGDWAEIRTCVLTDDTVTGLFEAASAEAKDKLTANGLAVRVAGEFVDLTTTSLAKAICDKITTVKNNIKILISNNTLNL